MRFFRAPFQYFGKDVWRAELKCPDGKDVIPCLDHARMLRVSGGILIAGLERIYASTKDHGTDHRQSWFCVAQRIPQEVFRQFEQEDEIPF